VIPELRFKLLSPHAREPSYATKGAAGLDLGAAISEPVTLAPGERTTISTGLAVALPPCHEGQVRPRSGLAIKHGVTVVNAPGTIDEDYRGEIRVALINLGKDPYVIAPGERIAQLVVTPVVRVRTVCVPTLDETPRGVDGFGSTGR